jgi:uncharacterized protein YbdZ (MbtH family)
LSTYKTVHIQHNFFYFLSQIMRMSFIITKTACESDDPDHCRFTRARGEQSMSWSDEQEDTATYKVVVNHEEQYSLWSVDRDNPPGWQDAGKSGLKAECLAYIQEVWTDMRPLSLRRQMEEAARNREQPVVLTPPSNAEASSATDRTPQDDLVQRLCAGAHPVEVILRPAKSTQALKACIDLGYVQVKFVNTRGGTELGVSLDPQATDLGQADFAQQRGTIHLVGGLTLNYVPVRCVADIDLATLTGAGHLEPVDV